MKNALLKFIPPILFALAGAVAFAWVIGPGYLASVMLIASLACMAVLTLLAIPGLDGPFRRADSAKDRSLALIWLASFWVIPVAGYLLIDPMSLGAELGARSFPVAVQPQLRHYFTSNGRYPASLAEVAFWDVRRLFVHYSTNGKDYRFWYRDSRRHSITHSLSSVHPEWTESHEYDD